MNACDDNPQEAITNKIKLLKKYEHYFSNLATILISQIKDIKNNLEI